MPPRTRYGRPVRVPFIDPEMRKRIEQNVKDNKQLGGMALTKADAERQKKKFELKGYISWIIRINSDNYHIMISKLSGGFK
jgi:superfamily II helicase